MRASEGVHVDFGRAAGPVETALAAALKLAAEAKEWGIVEVLVRELTARRVSRVRSWFGAVGDAPAGGRDLMSVSGHNPDEVMSNPVPSRPPVAATEPGSSRRVLPAAEDLADIQAGLAEAVAGKGVDLTPEELAEWARTGELPAAVKARLAACG